MGALTERERYRFDVQGFLVVPEVLDPDEVGQLNRALDANLDRLADAEDATQGSPPLSGSPRGQFWNMLEWPHPWCEPFRALIAHPRLVSYLDALLGTGWHLDHKPEVLQIPPGGQGHALHFGHWWNHPGIFYSVRAGQIRNGMVVVEYLLADQPAGGGGFACIPGSHKSNFRRPDPISRYLSDSDLVHNPGAHAGDAILFTEALTHGALPWHNDHTRRTVIHRYAAKTVQYGPGFHEIVLPDWSAELSPVQRAALEPAHFYDRDQITDTGVIRSWDDYDKPSYPYE